MPRKNIGSVLAGSWLSIARYVCPWHIASLRCCATISRLSEHSGPRKPSASRPSCEIASHRRPVAAEWQAKHYDASVARLSRIDRK